MKIASEIRKVKFQLRSFLGKLPVCKTAKRFVLNVVYGITGRASLRLTEIGRALQEPIKLQKTVNRLSQQLDRAGLWLELTRFTLQEAKERINDRTLLVLDLSDITKRYAEKMEYMATVRDGSKKELGNGYWLCQIVGVESGRSELTPLLNHLWSQKAPGHHSENEEILRCMGLVQEEVGPRGIWVIDRGGDRGNLFYPFLDRGWDFLVRLMGTRFLRYEGTDILASDLAKSCPLPYRKTITHTSSNGNTRVLDLQYGFRKVRLPERADDLYMIVVQGFGDEPLMLLTNVSIRRMAGDVWWFIESYITRWRVEDLLRFLKQSYHLEDIRLLGYRRLQNMMALLMLTAYFNMVVLGQNVRLRALLYSTTRLANRLVGAVTFQYYAIAEGLREMLSKSRVQPFPREIKPPKNPIQMCMFHTNTS